MATSKKSPYANTPIKDFYLDIYVDRPIPADDDDFILEIESKHQFRPDLLSNELYGNPRYWWIFMRRNMSKIKDPIYGFEPGLEIFAPTKARLQKLLNG